MIVLLQQDGGLSVRRVRLLDRLTARVRASALDHELAAGASPESSIAMAVHAGHLCGQSERRLLARSLLRIASSSDTPARFVAPISRGAVRRAHTELEAVIDRLLAPGPVDVHGVARIRTLLADGTGPLYRGLTSERLRAELRATLAAMDTFS
jgi:hypothetical protein